MQVEERLSFQESKKLLKKKKNCDAGISGRFISRPAHCFNFLIKFYNIVLISNKKKKQSKQVWSKCCEYCHCIKSKKKITYLLDKLYKMIMNE